MSANPFSDTEPPGLRADARRNRARVLLAAQEAFAAEGLAVPLDEIARRAGVGAGTVYRHFPTKETLFETIVLGRVREMAEHVRELAQAPDPGDAFFRMIDELVEQAAMKRDLTDALTAAGVDISDALAQARSGISESIATVLARAQAAGTVRDDIGPHDLMMLLSGTFIAASRPGGGPPRQAMAVIIDGLRVRSS
jgi:AcrR family transcriptional regulator